MGVFPTKDEQIGVTIYAFLFQECIENYLKSEYELKNSEDSCFQSKRIWFTEFIKFFSLNILSEEGSF